MAALDARLVFEDEAGFSMTPPTTRTWSRRGHTPVIRVRGRTRRRLSVAALACYKAGERSRLIYRPCPDARPDGRKSFSWKNYRDLIQTAHQQLDGPIVLVWDNLNTHLTAGTRRYIADRDWLTVFQLPPYAPDLNPVEGIWSVLRRTTTANRAFADPEDLITAVRRGLRQLQYRHDVLDGCLPAPVSGAGHHDDITLSKKVTGQFRAFATRYDKRGYVCLGTVTAAAVIIRFRA